MPAALAVEKACGLKADSMNGSNASSVGMSPRTGESPLAENVVLPQDAFVFDLVYNPPATKFLRQAEARGVRVLGGLDMLIYQGARAFELWTGARAPIDVMRSAAADALQELMRTQTPEATR